MRELEKVRVGIVGATGYTGAELVRILSVHRGVELSVLTSESYGGQPFEKVYPALRGIVQISCIPLELDRVAEGADVVFTCLPHTKSMECVPGLLEKGKVVLDLSADFRLKRREVYEAWYAPHKASQFLESAVYGLPELYRESLRRANLIAVPGCYPTSAILALAPLASCGLLSEEPIVVNSASGVTGAGRSLDLGSLFCEVNEGLKAYKVAQHRHTPEMEEEISRLVGQEIRVTFVPHLVPMSRGILSTIYVRTKRVAEEKELLELYREYYGQEPFIRVLSQGQFPNVRDVRGTNFCDIGIKVDGRTGLVIIISAIDNLVKGASGQAVQCMNLRMGFAETEALEGPALFL